MLSMRGRVDFGCLGNGLDVALQNLARQAGDGFRKCQEEPGDLTNYPNRLGPDMVMMVVVVGVARHFASRAYYFVEQRIAFIQYRNCFSIVCVCALLY